jgi:hypothetical protein
MARDSDDHWQRRDANLRRQYAAYLRAWRKDPSQTKTLSFRYILDRFRELAKVVATDIDRVGAKGVEVLLESGVRLEIHPLIKRFAADYGSAEAALIDAEVLELASELIAGAYAQFDGSGAIPEWARTDKNRYDVRRRRESLVDAYMKRHGITSRAKLARKLGISERAILGIIKDERGTHSDEKRRTFLQSIEVSEEDW